MAGPAAILRELHRLQRHAKDLQTEIDRGPRALKAQQDKVAKQEEILREGHELLKRFKVAIHEKDVTLKAKQQQIAKHQKQLNEATSKKEYDALLAEIASEKKACARIEDDILEVMGASEEQAGRLPALEQGVQRAQQDVSQVLEDIQTRRNSLVERLAQVHEQLKQIEATLPLEVRALYERQLSARGEDALSAVLGRTCTACYTEITAQSYNDLLQGSFVVCKSCGRILYLPEADSAAT